ncbi:CotD family spore coat protein [Sporolactobacillus kofuensis]|uniref:CotD family spore coat protein n=1 Tax=Sporolactobacillus kofuensis TaxID=269672 RepID=A0ABW1WIK2_9BACL|nr:CotD family spore coat protein [Sporolactobacillus kofuensis]MCO7176476.1 CotD family spore coat protein [Sporolactobacillus kofuensis]
MEVSPYSSSMNPVQSGASGNVGNVGSAGTMGNMGSMGNMGNMGSMGSMGNMGSMESMGNMGNVGSMSTMAPKPESKPMKKWPSTSPAMAGKGKGMMPTAHQSKSGKSMAPEAMAGKTTENTLHCPPTQGGTIYDPQSVNVQHIYKPVIVKHIHQMHTIRKTHYIYEHQHFYPHTMSETCDERHYDVQCEKPFFPKPHC